MAVDRVQLYVEFDVADEDDDDEDGGGAKADGIKGVEADVAALLAEMEQL